MPKNRFQRTIFALLTVFITVHAYVVYSLFVVNAGALTEMTGASGVPEAIRQMGGVFMLGRTVPVWAVVAVEFVFAFLLEMILGSPLSFRLACRAFDPRKAPPVLFETSVICATVGLMCPAMSFIAAWLYYPYFAGFDLLTLLTDWLKLVCFNLPFAFFSQLFFIQPLVRTLFKLLFRKDLARRVPAADTAAAPETLHTGC